MIIGVVLAGLIAMALISASEKENRESKAAESKERALLLSELADEAFEEWRQRLL
jgi:hypothetical protein